MHTHLRVLNMLFRNCYKKYCQRKATAMELETHCVHASMEDAKIRNWYNYHKQGGGYNA
eukprot:c19805_g1_i2 orf=118-294(+)